MNDEQRRIDRILRSLNLPLGEFFINGSGVLVLHGIPRNRPLGDLDLFTTTRLWFDLFSHPSKFPYAGGGGGWGVITPDPHDCARCFDPAILRAPLYGVTVDVFHSWRKRGVGDFDPAFYLKNAQSVHGWPCAPLEFIVDWKLGVARDKDLHDVLAIREYLGTSVSATDGG